MFRFPAAAGACRRRFSARRFRHTLTRCVAALLAALAAQAVSTRPVHAEPDARPNIVLIMVDDMGFSDLGCYGGEIQTPNLDKLAQQGLRFTQFYNTAKCAETRATLLTGRYFPEVGTGALRNCMTLAEALRSGGYTTLMTGKWHLGSSPVQRGWDRYFGHLSGATNFFTGDKTFRLDDKPFDVPKEGFYTTDANTDYAIRFLEESTKPGKPFFLYMAFNAPHYPLQAPEEDVRKYLGKYDIGWDELRRRRYERMTRMGIIDKRWALSPRPADVPAWDSLSPEQKREHGLTMATFAAMVDRVDQNIGRLCEKLEQMNAMENTLILFLSDNGGCPFQRTSAATRSQNLPPWNPKSYWTYDKGWAHACNTPFRLYKRNQHEGGVSTPLIAHWPRGVKQTNALTGQVGHLIDIMPTCLELAGVELPSVYEGHPVGAVRGRSLTPIFAGKQRAPHEELFFLFGPNTNRALRQGKWKLVSHDRRPWELYDVDQDRTELHDLAAKYPERVEAMTARWEALCAEMGPAGKAAKAKKRRAKAKAGKAPPEARP